VSSIEDKAFFGLFLDKNDKRHTNHEQIFDSPDAFFENQENASKKYSKMIKNGKTEKDMSKETLEYVNNKGKIRYEKGLLLSTKNPSVDKSIHDKLSDLNKQRYNLFFGGNCNDQVDDAIDKHMWTSDSPIPNLWYYRMEGYVKPKGKRQPLSPP
ncbi:hypothetical protein, partial [Leptospira sp. id769339]